MTQIKDWALLLGPCQSKLRAVELRDRNSTSCGRRWGYLSLDLQKRMIAYELLAVWLALFFAAGCAARPYSRESVAAHTAPPAMMSEINRAIVASSQPEPTTTADYRLGAGDVLEITLFNVAESGRGIFSRRTEVRVTQEGMITLPLLGDIAVAGLTTSALEQVLRQRYDEYLHGPQVGVYVKDYRSQRVSVLGAVHRPGVFQLTGPNTLGDVLAQAGGITERASSRLHIYRQEGQDRHTYVVDLLALASNPDLVNMPVHPGDVINVPQSGMFFVHGAVLRPGSYPLAQPYMLRQAIAVAGGVNTNLADHRNVAIFRRRAAQEADMMAVDLKAILAGEAADVPVEADDVIVVPISSAKWFLQRFIGTIGLPGVPGPT